MADGPTAKDNGIPLGDIALDMVRRAKDGPEKYTIHPKGPEVLKAAVKVVLLCGEPRDVMAGRFRSVITVCWALAEREGSPKAARTLADALFSDPKVIDIVRGRDRELQARTRAYRKFLDDKDVARAPKLGDRAPEDALRLTSFLSPGQQDMTSRARQAEARRQRLEAHSGAQRPAGRRPPPAGSTPPSGAPRRRPIITGAAESKVEEPKPVRRPPPGARKV